MAYPPAYTFSAPVELREDKLFSVDRKHAALTVNIPAHASHVVTVTDEPGQWTAVAEQAGAQVLSSAWPGSNLALQGQAALIRSALRPASRGGGRDRWR
jgi:hypothetical protein